MDVLQIRNWLTHTAAA